MSSAIVDQHPITIGGAPQGGVLTRKYRILAQGDYEDVQAAFSDLSRLPPTVTFESYDVEAMPLDGQPRARVAFEIEFGFNFLVSQLQFDAYTAMASNSAAASGSTSTALFDGSLVRSIQERAMSMFGSDHQDVTDTASESTGPDAATSSSTTVSFWWEPINRWICPEAIAAPLPTIHTNQAYTFGDLRGSQIGRKEPFMPLVQLRQKSKSTVATAKSSLLEHSTSHAEEPEGNVTLDGVLLSPGGPATAYLSFDGQRLRVKPGTVLVDGSQVEAIGRDFLLLRRRGNIRRIGLGVPPSTTVSQVSGLGASSPLSVSLSPTRDVTLPPPVPRVAPQP